MMENRSNNRSCPQCGARAAANAEQCRCGHRFNSTESFAPTLEEERLYQEYLAARTRQAVRTAIVAQTAHKADPNDPKKAAQAEQSVHEAESARVALAQQNAKVLQLVETINKTAEAERLALQAQVGRDRLGQVAERAATKVTRIKICPQCKAAAPRDIPRCKCGHPFTDAERLRSKPSVSRSSDDALSGPKKND